MPNRAVSAPKTNQKIKTLDRMNCRIRNMEKRKLNANNSPKNASSSSLNGLHSEFRRRSGWESFIRIYLRAFHGTHSGLPCPSGPRHQSGPSHLAIPPMAIWGSIRCRGPAATSYPLRRMRPRRWASDPASVSCGDINTYIHIYI